MIAQQVLGSDREVHAPSRVRARYVQTIHLRSERFTRSWKVNVATILVSAALLLRVESQLLRFAVLAHVCVYGGSVYLYRTRRSSRGYSYVAALDELTRYAVIAAAIYVTGSVATLFLSTGVLVHLLWRGLDPMVAYRSLLSLATTHSLLVLALASEAKWTEALLLVLFTIGSVPTARFILRLQMRELDVRVETAALMAQNRALAVRKDAERIARELHDGFGADMVALLLRIRRLAPGNASSEALGLRIQRMIDELRATIWALKRGQGTLGELAKLVRSNTRRLVPSAACACEIADDVALLEVSAGEALRVLEQTEKRTKEGVVSFRLLVERDPSGVPHIRVAEEHAGDQGDEHP
jgi:signal transduction histidine kinase